MPFWERAVIAAVVIVAAVVLAKLVDIAMRRVQLKAGAETRYRVLRRAVMVLIIFVAVFSALLVFPQVRSVAGAILASGAVIAIIVGFASQRTLGNFVAGILIAFTQPLRIGDRVTFDGAEGVVEEITLTYTFLRADDDTRIVIPNEKLASDTIHNATIVHRAQRAEITVQLPLSTDLAERHRPVGRRGCGPARARGVPQRPRRQRDGDHPRARGRPVQGRAAPA